MKKSLNELIKHFKTTGEILPDVYEHQVDYIMENIQAIFDEYIEEYGMSDDMSFEEHFMRRNYDWLIYTGFTEDMMNEYFSDAIGAMEDDDFIIVMDEEEVDEPIH